MGSAIDLYHGSRNVFNIFDPSYIRTGEGAGSYDGWYFCSAPKGALRHCESYLKCDVRQKEGFILHCQVEKAFVDIDIEDAFTEPCYGRPVYGVLLENSSRIYVVRVTPARDVFESIYGKIKD